MRFQKLSLKRAFDVAAASAALVVLSPVMLATAVGVKVLLRRPVIFRQTRYGLNTVPFEIFKFPSYRLLYDENGALLPEADRITHFGRFLRLSKLDEVPQFYNVLKGDMSIVGPRPRTDLNTDPIGALRYEVLPGMTGPTQVAKLPIPAAVANKLNADYVEGRRKRGALARDFVLLVRTPFAVLINNIERRYDYATPRVRPRVPHAPVMP